MISPVVEGNQSLKSATALRATGVESLTFQPSGARAPQMSSNAANDGIDFAAMVRIGPEAIKLQRIFLGPRAFAK